MVERRPLDGIRILDFTWVRSGPWATRWLAILGADIIKVEWPEPSLGGYTGRLVSGAERSTPAGVKPGINTGGDFSDTNPMKRSVTINARTAKGLALIKRLLAMSDVVIENFSTGVLNNWGLSYEEMTKIKPDIIYVSMAGLGQTGRNKHYNTMGPIVQALSGLTFTSGLPGAPPAGWGWSYMDNTGGMYAVMCVLTALHHRLSTGEGQWVDMSQVAAGITLTGPSLLDKTVNGRNTRREFFPPGNRAVWPGGPLLNNYRGPATAPHNAYRTKGGGYNDWCVIACFSDQEWRSLVELMGSPAWANDDRFVTVAGRIQHQEDLDRGIETWTLTLEKYELADCCQVAGVRAAPVQSNEDRVEHDPQLRAQGMYTTVHHPVLGDHLTQNTPFTFSKSPTSVEKSGPLCGENNPEILGGMLGLSAQEIREGYGDGTFWPKTIPPEPYLLEALEVRTA
jgi:crotonobetainyl-CoA:carnitine CoA-transferase CaiB-like acyl-CoA transferase